MGMLIINDKLNRIEPYIVDKTEYSVKLDANESFLNFPQSLKEELMDALMKVLYNRYPDPGVRAAVPLIWSVLWSRFKIYLSR